MPNVPCGKWLLRQLRRNYDEMSRSDSEVNNNNNNKLWRKTRSFKSRWCHKYSCEEMDCNIKNRLNPNVEWFSCEQFRCQQWFLLMQNNVFFVSARSPRKVLLKEIGTHLEQWTQFIHFWGYVVKVCDVKQSRFGRPQQWVNWHIRWIVKNNINAC